MLLVKHGIRCNVAWSLIANLGSGYAATHRLLVEVPTNTSQRAHSRGNFQIPYHIDIYKQIYLYTLDPRVLEVRLEHANTCKYM